MDHAFADPSATPELVTLSAVWRDARSRFSVVCTFTLAAAQTLTGHSSLAMTAHYATKMDGLVAKVAAAIE